MLAHDIVPKTTAHSETLVLGNIFFVGLLLDTQKHDIQSERIQLVIVLTYLPGNIGLDHTTDDGHNRLPPISEVWIFFWWLLWYDEQPYTLL